MIKIDFIRLKTDRLTLFPLTAAMLNLWLNDVPALERATGLCFEGDNAKGAFGEIVAGQLEKVVADPANAVWHTFWFITRNATVIGAIDFKAPPDADGTVEIGYGLNEIHTGHGYMTESVRTLCAWAKEQPSVKRVIAETEKDNVASQAVLLRAGFVKDKEADTLWFKREF